MLKSCGSPLQDIVGLSIPFSTCMSAHVVCMYPYERVSKNGIQFFTFSCRYRCKNAFPSRALVGILMTHNPTHHCIMYISIIVANYPREQLSI